MVSLSYYHNPKQHIRIDEQAKKAVIVPLFFLARKSQTHPISKHAYNQSPLGKAKYKIDLLLVSLFAYFLMMQGE